MSAPSAIATRKASAGLTAYLSGANAEATIAAHYTATGCRVLARRWRGGGGEIDLIVEQGEMTIFVEVKAARSLAIAAERLHPAQLRRIERAASAYLATAHDGMLRAARIDVALVDASGQFQIIENATLH